MRIKTRTISLVLLLAALQAGATEWSTDLPIFSGGSYDGWDRDAMAGSVKVTDLEVSLSSGSDQTFLWTEPSAELAMLTITATSPAGTITNDGTMRVFVPAAWGCRFDTNMTVTLDAIGAGEVGSASYADGGRTLEIPVTADFTDGDTLTIAGLKLLDLALGRAGNQRLGLDFTGDGSPDKYDENTLTLSVPWPGGSYDGWDRGAMAESKEIKPAGGTLIMFR